MASEESPERHRRWLPPGTVVEGWRLLGCHGHGAHGVVYRAVQAPALTPHGWVPAISHG